MRRFLIPSILAASLLGSCVSGGGDTLRLGRLCALGGIPASCSRSAEDFVLAAGFGPLHRRPKSLADLLREKAKDQGDMLEAGPGPRSTHGPLPWFPIPPAGNPRPRLLWLPLKGKGQFEVERFRESMDGFEGESAFVAGYAALAPNGPAPAALRRSLPAGRLSRGFRQGLDQRGSLADRFPGTLGAALRDAFRGTGTSLWTSKKWSRKIRMRRSTTTSAREIRLG